jgi:asparagine synthase (glutamine-hydrolysing)
MSGLCGWLATAGTAAAGAAATNADTAGTADHAAAVAAIAGNGAPADGAALASMAAPLSRFDSAPLAASISEVGGVAVAAIDGSRHVYQQDGLQVAIWGRPVLDGSADDVACRLASLWLSRGAAACASLSGPFSLAILDAFSGSALLAVDRAGMHPLSYASNAHGLFFASSHDALLAHPSVRGALDPQALYHYLFFHMVPGPATTYLGQQRLLPGEYLHVRGGKQCKGSYWQLAFQEPTAARTRASFASKQQEFLRLLRQAVESSLGTDGADTGAFLSGGTDSSTLAAIMGQVTGRPARTYSIGFDSPGYDEMAYARLAASHAGSIHHERYVTPADVLAAIPAMAAIFDQPFGNASAIPAFYCAQMAREDGVTRLLGGDGGDELFGGNERYAHQALLSQYERLPAMLRQAIIEPLLFRERRGKPWRLGDKARRYIELSSLPLPARLDSYNLLLRHGHSTVLEAGFIDTIDPGMAPGCMNGAYWERQDQGLSQINELLALDMRFTLADNDLFKVRKACELAGVEAAFPFLHDAMVAFAAGLAPRDKLDGTRLRPFFKRALADILPPAIVRKKKHGFGLPFGLWLHSHVPLREFAFDNLTQLRGRGIVRPAFIDDLQGRLLAEHPAYHGTMVWLLLMLEQWLRQHPGALGALSGGFAACATETPVVLDPTA